LISQAGTREYFVCARSLNGTYLDITKDKRTITDQWRLHAERLLAWSDFAQNFAAYLAYDICLHQAYIHDHSLFHPDEFQWALWDAVKDDQREKKF